MKYKIASINLLLSLSIIMVFLSFAYTIWHPYSFSELNGFSKSAGLIVLVNICLGPLLVLLLYKKNKRHLNFDLYSIALVQIGAFILGAYSIYIKHPVYAVFTVDRFTLINAHIATPGKVRYEAFRTSFFSEPKLVFAKFPTGIKERNALLMGVLFEGQPDLDERAEYYEPFYQYTNEIEARGLDVSVILTHENSKTKLNTFIQKYGGNVNNYVYFPLQTTNGQDVIWAFIKGTLQPVDTINIDPWIVGKKKERNTEPENNTDIKPWQMMAMSK